MDDSNWSVVHVSDFGKVLVRSRLSALLYELWHMPRETSLMAYAEEFINCPRGASRSVRSIASEGSETERVH